MGNTSVINSEGCSQSSHRSQHRAPADLKSWARDWVEYRSLVYPSGYELVILGPTQGLMVVTVTAQASLLPLARIRCRPSEELFTLPGHLCIITHPSPTTFSQIDRHVLFPTLLGTPRFHLGCS